MASMIELMQAWGEAGAWVWIKQEDGSLKEMKLIDFWFQRYDNNPELAEEFRKIYANPSRP